MGIMNESTGSRIKRRVSRWPAATALFSSLAKRLWVHPSLGLPVLEAVTVVLFVLFLILGTVALWRNRFAFKAASSG